MIQTNLCTWTNERALLCLQAGREAGRDEQRPVRLHPPPGHAGLNTLQPRPPRPLLLSQEPETSSPALQISRII